MFYSEKERELHEKPSAIFHVCFLPLVFFALDLNFILNKMDTEGKQADDKGRENV